MHIVTENSARVSNVHVTENSARVSNVHLACMRSTSSSSTKYIVCSVHILTSTESNIVSEYCLCILCLSLNRLFQLKSFSFPGNLHTLPALVVAGLMNDGFGELGMSSRCGFLFWAGNGVAAGLISGQLEVVE